MKIGIMQPTYLPWAGYFDLMDQVDTFVLLDNVQFSKQSWQQRNRIKTPRGLQWLTVPAGRKGGSHQAIMDVEINPSLFVENHLRTLEMNYSRARHSKPILHALKPLLQRDPPWERLADLNIALLDWMRNTLGIHTRLVRSSELQASGQRTELLVSICAELGGASYLSPIGAAEYLLGEMHLFNLRGISVTFQHFVHPTYSQLFPPFLPYTSAIDLLCNEGPAALEILQSGRRPDLQPAAVRSAIDESLAQFQIERMVWRFRRARAEDSQLVWEWANEPATRAVSFSLAQIPWDEHQQWFEAKLNDPRCLFLIVSDSEGTPVGQVRFDMDGPDAVISISLVKQWRGRGYGPTVIRRAGRIVLESWPVRRINAFIHEANTASLRAFGKAGFAPAEPPTGPGNGACLLVLQKEQACAAT